MTNTTLKQTKETKPDSYQGEVAFLATALFIITVVVLAIIFGCE